MKNLIQYLKLWQKKRGELQIDTDAGADWMEMRALLDKHMPGNDDNGGGSRTGGIRLLPTILIALSAAAMTYFTAKVVQTKPKAGHTKNETYNKKHGSNTPGNDSLAKSDNLQPGSDSASNTEQYSDAENKTGRNASSAKPGNLQPGSESASNKEQPSDAENKTGRSAPLAKPSNLQPGPESASNIKQPSDAENKTGRNASSAKPGNLPSGSESASNIKQPSDAGNKTGGNAPSAKPGNLPSGSASAGNIKQLSDAENKAGLKLLAAGNRPSRTINSGAAKVSSSDAAGIKKNNVTTTKDFVQAASGTSTANKITRYGRHNSREGNTGAGRPNSSQGAANRDEFTEGNNTSLSRTNDQYHAPSNELMMMPQPGQSLFGSSGAIANYPIDKIVVQKGPVTPAKTQKNKANRSNGTFEWGVLIGTNSNGSFTAKNQNHNFYGSLPVDFFTGAYGTYHLNPKWGIGTQVMILSPMVVKGGTYTDSLATHRNVSDSKKVYSVQFPLYTTYQYTKSIGFKAGPVISFPVKQYNTNTQIDSVSSSIITHSRYDEKPDYGFTGGVNFRYKRIIFETTYLKGLTRHSITSDSLIHKSTNNTFQFTIRLQLGNIKE